MRKNLFDAFLFCKTLLLEKMLRLVQQVRQLLDERQVTRNKLRTLTGVKYDVINRYYQAERVQMVDLDFLAKVCCVFGCEISDLLEYRPQPETRPENE